MSRLGRKAAELLHRPMRGRAPLLAAFAAVVIPLAAGAGPPVFPARAATPLDVVVGYDGFHVPGRAVPVRVTVTAERLVRGELVVGPAHSDRGRVELPVEVPGASVKRFVVALPPGAVGSLHGVRTDEVIAELRAGGHVLARGEGRVRAAEGQELVGLLPGVLAARPVPGPAPLAVDAGLARFTALDAADLARGAGALDPLSAIGISAAELAALPGSARDGLFAWVAGGGHLLVDAEPGGPLPGLPAGWQPGAGARAPAGAGEVVLTAGAMASGRWAGLVEPTARGRLEPGDEFWGAHQVADTVARDAGLRLPSLGILLGFLALYILAVGPLTALGLRRLRRPELAWAVVPALAVVFTAGSYAAGSGTRSAVRLAHGSVVEVDGQTAVATSYVGLTRPGAGSAHVGFPGGWNLRPVTGDGHRRLPAVRLDAAGPEALLRLDVGQFEIVKAAGPVALAGNLEVTASAEGHTVHGRVHNGLPFALEEAVVFAGAGVTPLGRLEPGEDRAFSVVAGPGVADVGGPRWFERFPGDLGGDRSSGPEGVVNLPLWQTVRAEMGAAFDAPGTALVVGWTRQWQPPLRLDGRDREAPGRTAVLARGPITPGPGALAPVVVRREVLRGPFPTIWWSGPSGPEQSTLVRFTLPEGGDGRPLAFRSAMPIHSLEVWREGGWQTVAGGGGVDVPVLRRAVPLNGVDGIDRTDVHEVGPEPAPPVEARPLPARPAPFPPEGAGIDASGGIPIPPVDGRVVFLRVRLDLFNSSPEGASVTLGAL